MEGTLHLPNWCNKYTLNKSDTDLVVAQYAQDGQAHTEDVSASDWVTQYKQWRTDDEDALGGASDCVRERRHQRHHTEREDVLQPAENAVCHQ